MKKTALIFLSLILVFSFAACTNNYDNPSQVTDTPSDTSQTEKASMPDNNGNSENGKILVVYYSATGSTKAVAETVAKAVNGELFELTPTTPYTSDDLNWTNSNSRVNTEHNDESKRDIPLVKTTVDNWSDYDTVFIGYPIWWGIAAWPVNNFVKGNDFTGKTVIPFCTSASSGLGQSSELLAQTAGTGNWQSGKRFSSGVSANEVEAWVNGLNLK